MPSRSSRWILALVIGSLGLALSSRDRATGEAEAPNDPLAAAVERGRALFQQSWGPGTKSCAVCHAGGKNKLTGARLKAYPKYDKALGKVATGQEKLNEMIQSKSKGTAFALGSAELTALEAFIATLR